MSERTKRDGIYAAGEGRWRIAVGGGLDPITGKYVRAWETVTGTRTDAKRRRDELRVNSARGTLVRADRETVAVFLERWIAHREHVGKVRPATAYGYRGHVRRIVTPSIGSMRLADVRPVHVQGVLDAALADGRAPRTIVQVHRILHAAFRSAVRWQAISSNPSDGVTPPKVEQARLVTPTPANLAAIFAAVDDRYRTALAVAAMTGLRRGEVLALRWEDVDVEGAPKVRVEGSLQRTPEGIGVFAPKTDRSRRAVPLPATLAAMLRARRAEQDERRTIAGQAWHGGSFVFERGDGRPVDPDAFGKAYREARDAAGVTGVRLHDLRHAYATMQIAEGTDARLVSDLLGHATVAFTLQTYVHPGVEAKVAAADTAERMLGAALA